MTGFYFAQYHGPAIVQRLQPKTKVVAKVALYRRFAYLSVNEAVQASFHE